MTLTIGDVLAVVMAAAGTLAALWALLVGGALLFQYRVQVAKDILETSSARAIWIGAGIAGTFGVFGLILTGQSNGLLKLIGIALSLSLLGFAAVGGSALSLLLGERILAAAPTASRVRAIAGGAGLLVVAGILPLLGWFLVAPIALLASLGAGSRAVLRPVTVAAPAAVSGGQTGTGG